MVLACINFKPGTANAQAGAALNFDGSNDYVNVPYTAALTQTSAVTFDAWFVTSQSGEQYILTQQNQSYYFATGLTSQKLCFYLNGVSGSWQCSSTSVTDGNWHYGAVVYDGSNRYVYVDGALEASTSASGSIWANTGDLNIGVRTGGNFFNGSMARVGMYSRALSPSEISQNCKANAARFSGVVCN